MSLTKYQKLRFPYFFLAKKNYKKNQTNKQTKKNYKKKKKKTKPHEFYLIIVIRDDLTYLFGYSEHDT